MIKKSFTINPNRTIDEIRSYKELLVDGIYQGCEIFYPYNKTKDKNNFYGLEGKISKNNVTFNVHVILSN